MYLSPFYDNYQRLNLPRDYDSLYWSLLVQETVVTRKIVGMSLSKPGNLGH